ncbi:MAG: hypothetical protein FJ253_03430 [Phycisphaerae bacterium]|nr:hypothetical protein [Phycisphaerae bacterium]
MSERGVTLILSDLHLGKGPCHAAALAPLLDGIDRLVLNGDSAELHLPGAQANAREELDLLHAECGRRGVAIDCLEGNHDLGISDRKHLLLDAGRVLVTHGDVFDPCVAPWAPWAAEARRAVERTLASMPPAKRDSLEGHLAAARAAAACEWADPRLALRHSGALSLCLRPVAVMQVLAYWRRYPRLAADFARRFLPQVQVIVCGHSHRPGAWRVDGRLVINTGHFEFPAKPCAVRIESGTVELRGINRSQRGYRLAESPRVRFTLAAAAPIADASTPVSMPQPESM